VALGVAGTTLNDELNRLANGGTYRASSKMVGQALAARQWAVQRSVTTSLTDTVGVLNAIAGTTSANLLTLMAYATSSLVLANYLQRKLSEQSQLEC